MNNQSLHILISTCKLPFIFIWYIQDSYYIDRTTVSGVSEATSVEKLSRCTFCYANGYDDETIEQLRYTSSLFGPVSSWTNAYRADAWNLYTGNFS